MRILFVLLVAIIVAGCQSLLPPKHEIGQTFQSVFVVSTDNTAVPLPPGVWELAAFERKHAPRGIYEEAFLFQAEGNKLAKFVGSFTDRTTAGNTSGWNLGKHGCLGMDKDDNFLLYSKVVVEKGYFDGGEDCYKIHSWRVNKHSDELSASIWNQFIRYLDRKNIQRPQEAVRCPSQEHLKNGLFGFATASTPKWMAI